MLNVKNVENVKKDQKHISFDQSILSLKAC